MKFEIDGPLLTTGGITTAIYNFVKGGKFYPIKKRGER